MADVGNRWYAQQPVAVEADFSVPEGVLHAYGLVDAHLEMLTGGRTNRTLRARAGRDVVLQQMLASGHADLLGVMENLLRVTSHLEWRRRIAGDAPDWYPQPLPTQQGKPFIMTPEGDVWRAFSYRKGQIVRSSQPLTTLASAGAMYGRFAAETADLGGPPLITTAPGFHDLDRAFDGLFEALDDAVPERRSGIAPLVERLQRLKTAVDQRCLADGLGTTPERVVHNDTKLSNVLFDREHGRAIAVLDLDLVMMGPAWHDVGDLVRSASWHAPHATTEPTCTDALFDAVVGAYVEAGEPTLQPEEIATFAAAGPRLGFELGIRYLHDHLRTEPHLMVRGHDGHLRRGKSNVKLAEEMLGAYDALRRIIDGFVESRPGRRRQYRRKGS